MDYQRHGVNLMPGANFQSLVASVSAGAVAASISFCAHAEQSPDATIFTFAATSIGTAATTRRVVVGVSGSKGSTVAVTSVTVAGSAATLLCTDVGSGGGAWQRTALYIITVPTGTTADIVVTFDSACARAGIGVWAVYDLQSSTPVATATSGTVDPYTSGSLSHTAGGVGIYHAYTYYSGGLATHTATNATERFDVDTEAGVLPHTGGDATFPTTGSTTITVDPTFQTAGSACFVSLR